MRNCRIVPLLVIECIANLCLNTTVCIHKRSSTMTAMQYCDWGSKYKCLVGFWVCYTWTYFTSGLNRNTGRVLSSLRPLCPTPCTSRTAAHSTSKTLPCTLQTRRCAHHCILVPLINSQPFKNQGYTQLGAYTIILILDYVPQ